MFTVDISKELLKESAKTIAEQNRLLAEANKLVNNNATTDIVVWSSYGNKYPTLASKIFENLTIQATEIKDKRDNFEKCFSEATNGEYFSAKHIEKVCNNYHLRCLPARHYTGMMGPNTEEKIANFEKKIKEKGLTTLDPNKFFIIAPANNFKLSKKPVTKYPDPILLYSADRDANSDGLSNYNVVIDKWGGDLSFINRIKGEFMKRWALYGMILTALLSILIIYFNTDNAITSLWGLVDIIPYFIILIIAEKMHGDKYGDYSSIFESEWNSTYL